MARSRIERTVAEWPAALVTASDCLSVTDRSLASALRALGVSLTRTVMAPACLPFTMARPMTNGRVDLTRRDEIDGELDVRELLPPAVLDVLDGGRRDPVEPVRGRGRERNRRGDQGAANAAPMPVPRHACSVERTRRAGLRDDTTLRRPHGDGRGSRPPGTVAP